MFKYYVFVEKGKSRELYWSGTVEEYVYKLLHFTNFFSDTAYSVELLDSSLYPRYRELYNALLRIYFAEHEYETIKQYESKYASISRIRYQMEDIKIHSYDTVPKDVLLEEYHISMNNNRR